MASFDWKRLYLEADGRISRQEFWVGFAVLFAVGIVTGWIPLLGGLIALALIYAHVCLGAKRLHDMGRSGWLMIAPSAVLLVCIGMAVVSGGVAFLSAAAGGEAAATVGAMAAMGMVMLVGSVGFLLNIAFLLWIGLTPGQVGDNAYGPDPMASTPAAAL